MLTVTAPVILSVVLHLVRCQISLLFRDNRVGEIAFDGQPLNLYVDTGAVGTYVIYKDWYKKTYGRCRRKTCYTCSGPCDPYSREKIIVKFDDGSALVTVFHQGVVEIGGYKLDMKFRLIIGWSPAEGLETEKPMNYLGLAYDTYAPADEGILVQLIANKIISEKTVSICGPSLPKTFAGNLILGSIVPKQCAITPPEAVIPMEPSEFHFNTKVSSVGLVNRHFEVHSRILVDGIAIYDSGAYSLTLYKIYFKYLLDTITEMVKQASGRDVHVKVEDDCWYIQQRGYDYLPSLTFAIGAATAYRTIFIPPSHYIDGCNGTWCALLLQPYNSPEIVFGLPFFTTHFSSFREIKPGQRSITLAPYASEES